MKKMPLPKFATEADEAMWWDTQLPVVERNLSDGMRAGTATVLTTDVLRRRLGKSGPSKAVTIRLPVSDIERARLLSQKKGIGYQAYLKILLHHALDREQAAAKKSRRPKAS
jgi:hypothetical protein